MPSENPLWFGYYPGDRPVYKKPGEVPPPTPLNPPDLGINAALDEAISVAGKPADMPASLWNMIADDWKSRFLIGASAGGQRGEELLQFNREEVTDAKGAYITINLVDLVTDPKKTTTKFIQNSLNPLNPLSGEFWSDLESTQDKLMWASLMDPPSSQSLMYTKTKESFGPLEFTGQGIYAPKEYSTTLVDPTTHMDIKVDIKGTATLTDAVGVTDVYEKVKSGTLEFVVNKKSAFFRNGGYRDMQNSFIVAASTEFEVTKDQINRAVTANPSFGEIKIRIDAFKEEAGLAESLSKFDGGLGDVQKVVTKAGLTGSVNVADVRKALDDLNVKATEINDQIKKVKSTLDPLTKEKAVFERDVKELENYIKGVNKVTNKYSGSGPLGRFTKAEDMVSDVQQLRTRLANARYMGGVQDRYLERLGRRYFEGGNSLLNLDLVDPATNNPIFSKGLGSIKTVYDVQKRAYWQESGRDIAKTLSKGEFGKSFMWLGGMDITVAGKTVPLGLIRDRIEKFTPGYWTNQVVERTHFFGLKYNDKVAEKGGVLPGFEKNPLLRTHTFTEHFTANGVKLSARLTGSKNLQAFYNSWESAKLNQLVGSYDETTKLLIEFGDRTENMKGFFDLLNGKGGYLKRSTKGHMGAPGDLKRMEDNYQTIKRMLLKDNKLGFHLSDPADITSDILNDAHNEAILGALFKEIGNRKGSAATISPFIEKIGVLQIYAAKISQAQVWIYKRLGLYKLAQPFVELKALVAQKIAGLATKLAVKVGLGTLTAASGGLAAVIMPLVEKVLNLVIAKTVDTIKDLGKAILKGNFNEAFDEMMTGAMKATEKLITCGCIVPIIFGLATFLLVGTVITSVSTVDRTVSNSSSGFGPVGGGPFTVPTDTVVGSNCPIKGGRRTLGSYTAGGGYNNAAGHGSMYYWNEIFGGGASSMFSIPFLSSTGWRCPGGYCSPVGADAESPANLSGASGKLVKSVPYYGYAADFSGGDPSVYAPGKVSCGASNDTVTSWGRTTGGKTSYGCWIIMESSDSRYKLMILHLNYCADGGCGCYSGKTYAAGQGITTWLPSANHIHTEISKDSVLQRPEDCLCK